MPPNSTLTIGDCVDRVRRQYLKDDEGILHSEIALRDYVMDAAEEIATKVMFHQPSYLTKSVEIVVTSTVELYAQPADFGRAISLRQKTEPGVSAAFSNASTYTAVAAGTAQNKFGVYWIEGDQIGIRVFLDNDTLVLNYICRPVTSMTTSLATFNYPDRWARLIPLLVAIKMRQSENIPARELEAQYERALIDLEVVEAQQDMDSMGTNIYDPFEE